MGSSPSGTVRTIPDRYRLTLACAVIACALAPAYVKRYHVGFYPTTVLEIGILATLLVFAIETVRQRRPILWHTPFTIPAVLFLLAGVISVIVAPSHVKALGLFRAYLVEPIAFFMVLATIVTTRRRANLVLAGLAVAGVVVSVLNVAVVLDALRHHALNVAVAPPVVIYTTANAVALFLIPLIGVAASLALYERSRAERIVSGVFCIVAGFATLLSFSRGGYLALAVMGLVLAATHPWRRVLVPAVVVMGVIASRIPPVASRLGHEVDLNDPNNSLRERFQLWGATLRMLRDHPLFGTGLSGFHQTIDRYRQGVFTEDLIYPHNIILNFWTETGLLGLAAILWILAVAFRYSWSGWQRVHSEWRPLCLGVFLSLIGMVVHGLVDVLYWKNDLSLEFWILLSLVWAATQADRREIRA